MLEGQAVLRQVELGKPNMRICLANATAQNLGWVSQVDDVACRGTKSKALLPSLPQMIGAMSYRTFRRRCFE